MPTLCHARTFESIFSHRPLKVQRWRVWIILLFYSTSPRSAFKDPGLPFIQKCTSERVAKWMPEVSLTRHHGQCRASTFWQWDKISRLRRATSSAQDAENNLSKSHDEKRHNCLRHCLARLTGMQCFRGVSSIWRCIQTEPMVLVTVRICGRGRAFSSFFLRFERVIFSRWTWHWSHKKRNMTTVQTALMQDNWYTSEIIAYNVSRLNSRKVTLNWQIRMWH